MNIEKFKIIFLDIGLTQALLGLNLADWFLNGEKNLNNLGSIVEAFVGQELLAYSNPYQKYDLFFWLREAEARNSTAEIDYLIQLKSQVIPIEVKSGKGSSLTSMLLFMETHPKSEFGIRYSTHNYSVYQNIKSYPLYAIPLSLGWQYINFFT
jgi:predicted AAA+ superfamily ATPase